jgi:hypothetical protein
MNNQQARPVTPFKTTGRFFSQSADFTGDLTHFTNDRIMKKQCPELAGSFVQ